MGILFAIVLGFVGNEVLKHFMPTVSTDISHKFGKLFSALSLQVSSVKNPQKPDNSETREEPKE